MGNSHFEFTETPLAGLYVIKRNPIQDDRGFFSRFFCADEFKKIGLDKPVVQMNYTYTKRAGSVRGFHYQVPPYCESKIVSCVRGEIFDVVVDVRRDSPTFLKWHAEILTKENNKALFIPEGFAHGFQSRTDDCEMLYIHTEYFTSSAEAALNVKDPRIGVNWPMPVEGLSERDQSHPFIDDSYTGIRI